MENNIPTSVDTSWAITGLPTVADVIDTIGYVLAVIYLVLQILGWWHVFKKAGEQPWKSIIPVYDLYIQFKLTWKLKYFWFLMASIILASVFRVLMGEIGGVLSWIFIVLNIILNIFVFVIYVIAQFWFSKSMGHGIPYCIGLIVVPYIFTPILGFGKSEYVGNAYEMKHNK